MINKAIVDYTSPSLWAPITHGDDKWSVLQRYDLTCYDRVTVHCQLGRHLPSRR